MSDIKRIFDSMEYGPAPESRKEADAWLKQHGNKFDLFINGAWVKPQSNAWFDTREPASGEKLGQLAEANGADVDAAVRAARAALPDWVALGGHGRARYLYALARRVQKHARLFAVLESLDNGKPIRETRDIDIPLVARHFYHHAGWAQLMEQELPDYQEMGVVGQIIPWNFPLLMLAWKIAPALAMGNTLVLKPAEYTSLTALLFAEICAQVGLPAGVVNIVTGAGETGAALTAHDDVDKIAFTGSTEVGRIIRRATAGSGKALSLELGGKSPFIVFEDADLDGAVEGLVDAIWFNQGQVCCAGSRLLMQESIAERLIEKVKTRMSKLRVGDPLDKGMDIGALVDPVQEQRIRELVELGEREGATRWQPEGAVPKSGCWFAPTLFTDVSPASTIAQEEIFGPVLVAMTFRTPAEAVKLANNTRYGLAASVWSENLNLALDVAPKIAAGTVWVNCTNMFDAAAGFGGYRESGFGREGGREGLYAYCKPRWQKDLPTLSPAQPRVPLNDGAQPNGGLPGVDRTAKLYIGGKQKRPDGGYTSAVLGADGRVIGEVSTGNRKDIRNAVEAAHKAAGWTKATAHNRAQVLYYVAENLLARQDEFVARMVAESGQDKAQASADFDLIISRIFTYAAHADKYDGHVHHTPVRNVTLAMPEALGVMGIVCPDEAGLLGFISTVMPALAMGNRVIAIPSETTPLSATDFYQVLETSDVPGGALNIVTGPREDLTRTLADHLDVDGLWYFGDQAGSALVEKAGAENMKRTLVSQGRAYDWRAAYSEGSFFLRHATQIKNIWVPYGE